MRRLGYYYMWYNANVILLEQGLNTIMLIFWIFDYIPSSTCPIYIIQKSEQVFGNRLSTIYTTLIHKDYISLRDMLVIRTHEWFVLVGSVVEVQIVLLLHGLIHW